jgi:hypothetical protein
MNKDLKQALDNALRFKGIEPSSIKDVEYNVGGIWFKDSEGKSFTIIITTCKNY